MPCYWSRRLSIAEISGATERGWEAERAGLLNPHIWQNRKS